MSVAPNDGSGARLSDIDIALYALYLLGGLQKRVHTEDVALKCFELVPHKFSWVKHQQYPDPTPARHALEDAKKEKYGHLVRGSSEKGKAAGTATGWMFTAEGVEWLGSNSPRVEKLLGERGRASDRSPRQMILRQLKLIKGHSLYARFQQDPTSFLPTIGELADLFRCRADADPTVWESRFEKAAQTAKYAGQIEVVDFVAKCRAAYATSARE